MRRRGQSALEYLFMIAAALVIIAVFLHKFFSPRTGTIREIGETESNVESSISSELSSMMNSS